MLFVGDSQHLFKRGQPHLGLVQSGFAQGAHPFAFGLLGNFERTAVLQDDALHLLGNRHDLVDADPPFVAIVAGGTAYRPVGNPTAVDFAVAVSRLNQGFMGNIRWCFALGAQPTGKALRSDQDHAGGNVEGGDAHIPHTGERGGRIVRVQR